MKLLVIGGSGGLSGTLARTAMEKGHEVWTVTRGVRPLPVGVRPVIADRNDEEGLKTALAGCKTKWDAVLDCICMTPEHARQDLRVLPEFSRRLVVVSTDSVYDPAYKRVPQSEEGERYVRDGSYAGQKRLMEEVFLREGTEKLRWTIFRPGHIYGPGFEIGCFPEHSRQKGLLEQIRSDRPLRLVGGGTYLIHPVFAEDLARAMLDCLDKEKAFGEIFCIGGPEAVENRVYYELLGRITGHPVQIEEVPEEGYVEEHPEFSGRLCERCYTLEKLKNAGICLPSTPLEEGLREHVRWLDQRDAAKTREKIRTKTE